MAKLVPSFFATTGLTALAVVACAAAEQSKTVETQDIPAAVEAYGAAWAARDVDQILALHSEDTEFRLFIDGTPPAIGREAVREQFEGVFVSNPSYSSTVTDMQLGENFVYIRYQIHMDSEAPAALGRYVFEPTGETYAVDAMDFIEFEDGLVTRKHTFLDTEAVRAASPGYETLSDD